MAAYSSDKTFTQSNSLCLRSLLHLLILYAYFLSSESDDQNYRVCAVHALVHKLPDRNKEMLELLIKHLVTYVFL